MMPPALNDPLLLLLAGLAIDALFGDMPARVRVSCRTRSCSPAGRSRFSSASSTGRSAASGAGASAAFVTVVVLVGGAAGDRLGDRSALCRGSRVGALIEALVIGILLAQRSLFRACRRRRAGAAQRAGWRPGARRSAISSGATRRGSTRTASRAPRSRASPRISATASSRRSSGICSLGLPGLFAYKMANTLDSMIGHRSERYRAFGWAAARFDDLLNLVPARLSGLLLAAAALFAGEGAAGPGLADDAARCEEAPFAERRLAGGGDGRRARPGAGRPAPLCRRDASTTRGSATARRGREPADIGRALAAVLRWPACC